jgi:hypothetical protein
MMNQDWMIRVQPAGRQPYLFKATFVVRRTGKDEGSLDVKYLYGDGDLAVLLEDLGAGVPEICGLIETLREKPSAEIKIDVTDEAMEILSRQAVRGAREGRA